MDKIRIYDVIEFGAVPDGKTLNSKAVQEAIDTCERHGGGKVVFSKGDYVLSTVFLKNNVRVLVVKRIVGIAIMAMQF